MDSAALYFYSICFCPLVSTQNYRDITKHDFSPVAPSSFVLLQSLSLSLSLLHCLIETDGVLCWAQSRLFSVRLGSPPHLRSAQSQPNEHTGSSLFQITPSWSQGHR